MSSVRLGSQQSPALASRAASAASDRCGSPLSIIPSTPVDDRQARVRQEPAPVRDMSDRSSNPSGDLPHGTRETLSQSVDSEGFGPLGVAGSSREAASGRGTGQMLRQDCPIQRRCRSFGRSSRTPRTPICIRTPSFSSFRQIAPHCARAATNTSTECCSHLGSPPFRRHVLNCRNSSARSPNSRNSNRPTSKPSSPPSNQPTTHRPRKRVQALIVVWYTPKP